MTIRRMFLVATSILLGVAWLARPVVLAKQVPPPAKAPSTASAPQSSAAKVPDIVIEQLDTTVRFEPDGTGEYQTAASIRVLTDGAVQQLAQMPYFYDASLGTARFEHLEVRKPSGQVSRAAADAITDTAIQVLPNVMTGLHQLQAPVPGLARGDLIDYRVVAKIAHPQIAGHFWWQHRFTVTVPVTAETLTIDVPSSRPVQVKTARGFEAVPPEGEPRDGRRIYRWTRSNPEVKPLTEVAQKASEGRLDPPDVLMTTFRSWDELGRWYLDAARDRDKPDAAIVAKAEELTRGLTSASDKLRALYEFVATESRYLSLSFGTGALVPHKASEVLANRYGDCKDRHTLLAALARAVGIRTYPALISSSQVLEPGLPTPAQTDHMITVGALGPNESDWVWLDSASGVAPFGLILPPLRNKVAVVLVDDATTRGGDGGAAVARLVTTPAAPPFPCFRRTRVEARLSAVGTLDGRATLEVRGDDEVVTRTVLRVLSADDRSDFLKTLARGIGLTGELTEPSLPDPAVARDPLRLAFRIRQENWFDRSKAKTLDLPIEAMTLPYANEKDWKDKTHLKPWSLAEEATVSATIDLPAGFLPKLPVDVTLTRDYAQYRSTHRFDGSRLTVERVLTVNAVELPAARMRDYLAFVAAVRSDEAQDILLDTTKAAPASAASDATPTELYRTGLSQYDARNYVGAITTLKRVVELAPKDPDAWDALGVAYDALYRWSDAVQAFQEQVKVEPFHKQAWMHLGWALQHSKKREEAIAAYRKQIEIVPLHSDAHRDLGELLLQDPPDHKEAAAELAKAEQITPDNAVVPVRLGGALLKLGDTASALAAFERARKLSPDAEVASEMALNLIDAGVEFDRGVADATAARRRAEADSLKLDLKTAKPEDARRGWGLSASWHALGWAAFKKGDYAGAQRLLSAARSVRNEAAISDHLSQAVEKLGWGTDAIHYAAESLLYAESRLVRERLLRLLGNNEAAAAQALEQARARVLSERSAEYGRVSPKAGSLDFVAIFTSGSKQPAVRPLAHDADLEPVLEFVRRSSFLLSFPDGTPARVPTDGRLFCAEKGQACFTVLYFGGSLEGLTTPVSKR
jgi:tetratricopeptide (TPR) repeat protein